MVPNLLSSCCPSIANPLWACYLSIPPMILAPSWRKRQRRSRSIFPPITFSSMWGEPCGSRSWSSCVFSLFFLSLSSIAFVALVGFEREGLEHLVCSFHCISCIGLSSPRWHVEVKVEKLITLECLGTLELVPLGCLGTLDGWWCVTPPCINYSNPLLLLQ